jgi:hypothetical protein
MNNNHIHFNTLSDLYDKELSQSEREQVLRHISECPSCRREYNALHHMLDSVSLLKTVSYTHSGMYAQKIMSTYKRRKIYKKVKVYMLPALAASFVFVIFASIIEFDGMQSTHPGGLLTSERQTIRDLENTVSEEHTVNMENMDQVVQMLQKNNARVLHVSDNFVIGEAPYHVYRTMKARGASDESRFFLTQRRGLRSVGSASGRVQRPPVMRDQRKIIRFKIYNK